MCRCQHRKKFWWLLSSGSGSCKPLSDHASLGDISNSSSIIPLTIWRLEILKNESRPSIADQTLVLYRSYLATTVQLNFAIVAACIPFLKPFMESINSGSYIASAAPMDSTYGAGSKLGSHSGDTSRKAGNEKAASNSIIFTALDPINPSNSNRSHNNREIKPTRGRPSDGDFHF